MFSSMVPWDLKRLEVLVRLPGPPPTYLMNAPLSFIKSTVSQTVAQKYLAIFLDSKLYFEDQSKDIMSKSY